MQTETLFTYALTLGLPQTNLNGFAESLFLRYAGHFQWSSIARTIGRPLSSLKTSDGRPIYATYYYIEEEFPQGRTLSSFTLDQELTFINRIRHFKGMAIDGEMVFDLTSTPIDCRGLSSDGLASFRGRLPYIRLCNVFISPAGGNDYLKISAPEGVSFDAIDVLPVEQHAYRITREAAARQTFGMFGPEWKPLDGHDAGEFEYTIDPDRDTNGAGLVYFANYICFIDLAERHALRNNSQLSLSDERINSRHLYKRKIAYFSNVNLNDSLKITTRLFLHTDGLLGIRTLLQRQSDNKLIALSEAQKAVTPL